jgi:hypothetical protein
MTRRTEVNVQKVVSAVVGLVIVVGGYGCRQVVANQSDDVAERITEEAIDDAYEAYEWDGPSHSVTDEDGTSVIVDDDTELGAGADVPEGWPADLEVVDGLDVLFTTADTMGLNVTGNLDGEIDAVVADITADLEAAGFTIDGEAPRTETDGRAVVSLTATGPDHTATIGVTETPNDVHGNLTIVYLLVPTA